MPTCLPGQCVRSPARRIRPRPVPPGRPAPAILPRRLPTIRRTSELTRASAPRAGRVLQVRGASRWRFHPAGGDVRTDSSGLDTLERATDRSQDTAETVTRRAPVTRRTVLAGIAGSAALTACSDLGPLLPGGGPGPSEPEPSGNPSAPAAPGPSTGG